MEEVARILLEIDAVKIDPEFGFVWASGIKSPIYCDNRKLISYPLYRDTIAEKFSKLIKEKYPDTQIIAGTATAGIPHAAWVAQKLNLPMLYVRSKAKEHGKSQQIEGVYSSNQNVILIEDLISTGKSSIQALNALRSEKLNVLSICSIMNYDTNASVNNFIENDIEINSLTNINLLLNSFSQKIQTKIKNFLSELK